MTTYLILDCNYLAHRAKHIFGDLSDKGSATGVVYGFLKDILFLEEMFDTNKFIFCWDSDSSKRQRIYPTYKAHRKRELDKDEQEFEYAFRTQVSQLRDIYLEVIGYKNVFCQDGYESDDVIAQVCKTLQPEDYAIIVTADQDLYQLIRKNISWYNPQTKVKMTRGGFIKKYGIKPKEWVKVKAIAGCHSDNIKGIEGVGEKTAIKYLKKELKSSTKAYKSIKQGWDDTVLQNRPLVELPYKGTKPVKIVDDKLSQSGWDKVCKTLGMKSLRYKQII